MVQDQDLVSLQEVRTKIDKAWTAASKFRAYSQQQVDAIVEAMAAAGRAHARELAELAVEETGYGNVKDKIVKNLLNADWLPQNIRGMKTVGVLREIPERKIVEIGVPVGVVAAVLPTTNPTSTAIFKTIISVKAGNAIVIAPHPRAVRCTCKTVEILYKAAMEAGAPEDIVQCLYHPSLEGTTELMKHRKTAVILATGGAAMVRAAYSSGKPAFGVGPGNVPVLLDANYDVKDAVAKVVEGKSFDYGTVRSSEQSLVAEESLRAAVMAELKANRAFFADDAQKKALEKILLKANFRINPDCVGQSPTKIAQMAGFEVPPDTSIIVAEIGGVGKEHPLSVEKLSPVLSLLFVGDFNAAVDACEKVLRFGGLGHTAVIFSNDEAHVREFGMRMPAMRVLVNTPSPSGSTGITTNVMPSMTLGCGAMAGNVTSDNVGPQHLINIKRIAWKVRDPEQAFTVPKYEPAARARSEAQTGVIDRDTVLAAVERYLAARGLKVQGAAPEPTLPLPAPVSTPPVRTGAVGNVAAEVVDRFLATRRSVPPPSCPVPSGPACGSPPAPTEPSGQGDCGCRPAVPATPAGRPAPKVQVVDFVSEEDVRTAIRKGVKIYIGPKTIVTPSARDLAGQHDILVVAQV